MPLPSPALPLLTAWLGCADKVDTGFVPPDTGDPVPTPDGHTFSTWTGEARWQQGWDPDPAARRCDLRWTTSGEPADPCEGCTWTFDVAFTYEADASVDTEDCLDGQSGDFTWTFGLEEDYMGYGVPVLWYQDSTYGWTPLFAASWSYPELTFGGGYLEYATTYEGAPWYYTLYWYGTATVR